MSSLKTTFHVLSIAGLTYPYWWIITHPNKINQSYGWHFQMLTILTLTVAYVHFLVAFLQDLYPRSATIRSIKRTLLLIAAPCETLVSMLYWPIKFYDPSLLAPPELMAMFELSADLSMHALPTALCLIELFVFSEALETSNVRAAAVYCAYGAGYYFWTERNAGLNGTYPYPLMDLMTTQQRVALFTAATTVAFGSYLILKTIYAKIHGKALTSMDKKLSSR